MHDRHPPAHDPLDEINLHLLRELQRDARQSFADLARQVGLTAPAVAERVRRMEASGLIQGYRAEVNHAALGLRLNGFVRLRILPGRDQALVRFASDRPEVLECHQVTGDDSYLLRIGARDVHHLDRLLTQLADYGATHCVMLLSTQVEHRILEPLPA